MTSHTDLGVPDDIYEAALRVMGHPWREDLCQCGELFDSHKLANHTASPFPIPPVTDELLWQMLVKLIESGDDLRELLTVKWDGRQFVRISPAAAVIRVMAAREVK